MDKNKIIAYLKDNGISNIEEQPYKDNVLVLNFTYEFDEDEVAAAHAYANDESGDEEEGDTWVEEFFIPYLSDLAVDTVGEIMEELMDEIEVDVQFVSYEIDKEDYGLDDFTAVFTLKDAEVELEEVLEELEK